MRSSSVSKRCCSARESSVTGHPSPETGARRRGIEWNIAEFSSSSSNLSPMDRFWVLTMYKWRSISARNASMGSLDKPTQAHRFRQAVAPSTMGKTETIRNIDPTATVHSGARVDASAMVEAGAMIGCDVTVGRHAHIGGFTILQSGVSVGEYATISDEAVVGPGTTIGAGSTVGRGVR
ncbi:MAG: hypothetical protein F4Y21_13210, partial [Gemmatimonadetes bacterium]|nr:hypothetical protein [Gemmatimonadota bacterium]